MSRARTLASAIGSDGALNVGDVAGLHTVATTGAYNDLTGKPALHAVATSGAYADLSGTPTLATVATSGSYNDLTNKPTGGGTPDFVLSSYGLV
jgi:hypothetical protein